MKERLSRETIALRAAREFQEGDLVNLGVGIPDMCTLFVPEGRTVFLHSENGVIGLGPILGEEEWEQADGFDCETWRPLLAWTLDDVIAIHRRHGLAPNPLYLAGASRVGCWPCIYARKDEIRHVADTDPARIDLIRSLEAELSASASKRGTDARRAWFQARMGGGGEPWPIDRVCGSSPMSLRPTSVRCGKDSRRV